MNPEHIEWCKQLFASMREGARWGIPRSGLVFQRRGEILVLIERMPYTAELSEGFAQGMDVPPSPEKLLEFQSQDFIANLQHFAAAGIEVIDETNMDAALAAFKQHKKEKY